ncbi:MarR family transcriptional regulator [Cytobacillus firmus]|uniref:MarR family transcriptional regulator n=1 Tax=Cytobacillus firmus TaxID=1399 RepID=UPI0022282566|nr:MarR family transcriptional regulator [Cytobacillus firmus]
MVKHNLGITEFSVLEVLYYKGKQNIHQVSQSALNSSRSMTYVIDKLEQKGFLEEAPVRMTAELYTSVNR